LASPTSNRRCALAFLAHPDDAEILCAGTLIRLADAGWEIHIATATAGDCGTMDQNPWQISTTRTAEGAAAAAEVGGTYHCLGEMDGLVVYDKPTLRKVIELFRTIAPSLVLTHAPKDYMLDHEMASLLARAASFIHGCPNVSHWPVREGTCVPHLYYCDPVDLTDPFGKRPTPTTRVNITDQIDRKARMLACHASQREWLRAHHGMDEYIEAMKRMGAERGKEAKVPYAEGFIQHLGHPYPQNDLLATLLG